MKPAAARYAPMESSEAVQRSFDATCRKLFRFLTGPEISRSRNARSSHRGDEPIASLTAPMPNARKRVAVKPHSREAVRRRRRA